MRPLRWLFCGLALVAAYRVGTYVGILLFAELKEVVGQQVFVMDVCGAFGLTAFGALGELLYRIADRKRSS